MDAETNEGMTHEDIWDDSALVDSWNQALEEYKKYHSIYSTKGAKLEGVPGVQKTGRNAKTETDQGQNGSWGSDRETSLLAVAREDGGNDKGGDGAESEASRGTAPDLVTEETTVPSGVTPPPMSLLGSVRDESLKSLLMAWYYAGYYTGLYEGQGQQKQEQKKSRSTEG